MLALVSICLMSIAASASRTIQAGEPRLPPTTRPSEHARRFAELAARTNALTSFVAEYRTKVGDADLLVTLAYEAPSRARVQWHGPGMNVDTWVIGGRMSIRGDFGRGPVQADVSLPEIVWLGPEFDAALREPTAAADGTTNEIGPGPVFAMEVVADPSRPDGRSMRCQVGWEPRRAHLLTWLATPNAWDAARLEDDRLLRDGPAGSALALSLKSGFFEWIRMKATLRLDVLRVNEAVPADTFVVPRAAAGARDTSDEVRKEQEQFAAAAGRMRAYRWALESAAKPGQDASRDVEQRERVFGALHAELQRRALGPWRAQTSTRIDEFLAKWSAEARRVEAGTPERKALDRAAAEWRASLAKLLDDAGETCAAGLVAPSDIAGDPAILESIRVLEQKMVHAVFDRDTAALLLSRFDAGIRAAGDG